MVNARDVNTRIDRTDQGAYINYATKLRESGFTYVGIRNRMPLYPGFVAITSVDAGTPEQVFQKAKVWNIWLSLGCMVVIAGIFFRNLPLHAAMNSVFLVGFTAIVFKAPHVQAEVLFYTLSFGVFILGWSLFRKPGALKGTAAGLTAGLAHLTKASILPGLFCLLVFYILDGIFTARKKAANPRKLLRSAVPAILVVVAFFVVVGPYLKKSHELHGRYFFNVNSSHYIWCNSWPEAVAIAKKAREAGGWNNLPPDEIPSALNYWKNHSLTEIASRLGNGASRVVESMSNSYGYLPFLVALASVALILAITRHRVVWGLFKRRPFPILALFAYFGGYFILISWYSQIIMGNRFILSLFIPLVFTLMMFISRFSKGLEVRAFNFRLPVPVVFQTAFSVWLAIEIFVICVYRLPTQYGGS